MVSLRNGWFPKDFSEEYIISEVSGRVDYVLLDCPKDENDFNYMIRPIKNVLCQDNYSIFVHDTHGYVPGFIRIVKEVFGYDPIFLTEFECGDKSAHQKFPMALITNK